MHQAAQVWNWINLPAQVLPPVPHESEQSPRKSWAADAVNWSVAQLLVVFWNGSPEEEHCPLKRTLGSQRTLAGLQRQRILVDTYVAKKEFCTKWLSSQLTYQV